MSLGGYKFAGRFCQKGSLTDAQWALLMHKTKVAAFMAANTLSGAGWDYDMTGSPDGNCHCLDSVGNNYVTVFKRTNGENDYTWFALYTLTKFTWSGTDSGAVKVYIIENYTNMYFGYYACNFFRIGTAQIAYNDAIDTSPTNRPNTTPFIPVGNPGTSNNDISSSYYPPSNSSTKDWGSVSYGFAVKGDNIVLFQGWPGQTGSLNFSAGYLCCSLASGHAFSSFVNDGDANGLFAYNTQIERVQGTWNYENSSREIAPGFESQLCAVSNMQGAVSCDAWYAVTPLAFYRTSVENYPFQSIQIFGVSSSAGVPAKGTVSVDLMAMNFPGQNQGLTPNIYAKFANGNYLVVRLSAGSSQVSPVVELNKGTTAFSANAALYVGWDPSNPDITQSSSWTEYTE